MRQFDKDNDEYYLECDNQFSGCSDRIWDCHGRELCTDCAFDEVFDADKGEKFLFDGRVKNEMAVLTYFFTDEEIVEILKKEAKKLKESVSGYIKYQECLKECIAENSEKDDFLRANGFQCAQEGWD